MTSSTSQDTNMLDDTSALDHIDPAGKGTPRPKGKSKGQGKGSGRVAPTSPAVRAKAQAAGHAVRWAHRYTGLAVVLSSSLNAYSSASHNADNGVVQMCAAGVIGALVPVMVWVLGTVTAWTYRAGWARLAYVSGGVACCVLALSVIHVAGALAALTGTGYLLSSLLAVGIDCGLVSSEATAILVSSVE